MKSKSLGLKTEIITTVKLLQSSRMAKGGIILALTFLVLVAVVTKAADLEHSPGCNCPAKVDPVCGSNGRTYQNDCEFRCAQKLLPNLRKRHDGRCLAGATQG